MKKTLLTLIAFILGLTAFSQIPNYVPQNGLVGWWPFNGNANDESGNGNNGTVNGVTLTTDRFGVANGAYGFNGVNCCGTPDPIQEILVSNQILNLGQNFTVSCWMSSSQVSKYQQCLFNSVNHTGFAVELNNEHVAGKLTYGVGNGNNWDLLYAQGYTTNFQNNTWYHVVFVKNGTSYYLYLNGSLEGTTNLIVSANYNQLAAIRFGAIGSGHQVFKGSLDDFGIWNRALTECEIQDLYQAQLNSVSQSISAGADQSICSGDNVTLSGAGGNNYQWNNNVVDGQTFAPTQSNAYVVTAQDSLGCTGTDTVVVAVLENSASTLTETALDSYTLNGQTYTQSGTYTQILTAANGCDSTITLNLTLNFTGIDELGTGAKKLIKITDLNGKTIPRRKNTLMLFIFEDGTVERVVEMEE